MKNLLLIAFIFLFIQVEAQNIVISFSSSNPNDKIDSVLIENLYQNKSRVIKGTDNLELTASSVGVLTYGFDPQFKIYPNPSTDNCYFQFENKVSGNVELCLHDFTGRQLVQRTISLEQGIHTFQVSGLPAGISLLKVRGTNLNQTGKIVSSGNGTSNLNMELTQISSNSTISNALKSVTSNVLMQYNAGETLKYTIYSGKNITVKTDQPTASKICKVAMNECIDNDGRSYQTVIIGTQTWMAENLAYLPSVNKPTQNTATESRYYVYAFHDTIVSKAKASPFYNKYGVLYNWLAALSACPSGWHLPSAVEWDILQDFLIKNGYGFGGNDDRIAKSLASSSDWKPNSSDGTIGKNPLENNRSGFSALPGGYFQGWFSYYWEVGFWYSSTDNNSDQVIGRAIYSHFAYVNNCYDTPKNYALSVRCIKD
jgi:uncharacterized protein (TIGR02145 family)